MIDLHCHVLPAIDDGPATPVAALALAQGMAADGITHAVLTPHVFPGRFENRRSSIEGDFASFRNLLRQSGVAMTVSWAGEVRLTPEILPLLVAGEIPFLGEYNGMKHVLLEMPDGQVPLGADRFVSKLMAQRIRPVIAHPERNRAVMENADKMAPLVDLGCLVQLTAGSLVGQFGDKAQATARTLLDRGWVHAVASDAHNLAGRRPRMRDAAQWLARTLGADMARELTLLGPARICSLQVGPDGEVSPKPPPAPRAAAAGGGLRPRPAGTGAATPIGVVLPLSTRRG